MSTDSMPRMEQREIDAALEVAWKYGQTDGEHHKAWVIDQMVRALTDWRYAQFVDEYRYGDADDEYEWSEGIAP